MIVISLPEAKSALGALRDDILTVSLAVNSGEACQTGVPR